MKHKLVRLTRHMLSVMGACKEGMAAVPEVVYLSTDPEQNYKLACEIAESRRAKADWHDSRWLIYKLAWCDLNPDDDHYLDAHKKDFGDWSRDPWVIAQHLAIAADLIDVGTASDNARALHKLAKTKAHRSRAK